MLHRGTEVIHIDASTSGADYRSALLEESGLGGALPFFPEGQLWIEQYYQKATSSTLGVPPRVSSVEATAFENGHVVSVVMLLVRLSSLGRIYLCVVCVIPE